MDEPRNIAHLNLDITTLQRGSNWSRRSFPGWAAFQPGDNERAIGTVDESGVALAAIQGLNQKLNEKDAEIQALKQSVAELKETLTHLTQQPN